MQSERKCKLLQRYNFTIEHCDLSFLDCKEYFIEEYNKITNKEKFKKQYEYYQEINEFTELLIQYLQENINSQLSYAQILENFKAKYRKKIEQNINFYYRIINNRINNISPAEILINDFINKSIVISNRIRLNANEHKNYLIQNSIGINIYNDYISLQKEIKELEKNIKTLGQVQRTSIKTREDLEASQLALNRLQIIIQNIKSIMNEEKFINVRSFLEKYPYEVLILPQDKETQFVIKTSIDEQNKLFEILQDIIQNIDFISHNTLLNKLFKQYKSYKLSYINRKRIIEETTQINLIELLNKVLNTINNYYSDGSMMLRRIILKNAFRYECKEIIMVYLTGYNPELDYNKNIDNLGGDAQEELQILMQNPIKNVNQIISAINNYYYVKVLIINNKDIFEYLNEFTDGILKKQPNKDIERILIALICNGFIGFLPANTVYKKINEILLS